LKKLLSAMAFLMIAMSAGAQPPLVLIVNAQSSVNTLTKAEIRDYYFKKRTQWPDGTPVRFVDRASGSELRNHFLSTIIGKSAEDVDLYWIGQKLYSGDSAPLQQSSEALTIQFVSNLKGAIGYISGTTDLTNKNIKTIRVENAGL
jgi:ABC-type phosphate transport system substrate-binding protein